MIHVELRFFWNCDELTGAYFVFCDENFRYRILCDWCYPRVCTQNKSKCTCAGKNQQNLLELGQFFVQTHEKLKLGHFVSSCLTLCFETFVFVYVCFAFFSVFFVSLSYFWYFVLFLDFFFRFWAIFRLFYVFCVFILFIFCLLILRTCARVTLVVTLTLIRRIDFWQVNWQMKVRQQKRKKLKFEKKADPSNQNKRFTFQFGNGNLTFTNKL